MTDQVLIIYTKLLESLAKAGRNKASLTRNLDRFKADILKRSGSKKSEWTEEYYSFLLEQYRLAIPPAIEEAISREEFEWAQALTEQARLLQPAEVC